MNPDIREQHLRRDLDFIMGGFFEPRKKVYLKGELRNTLRGLNYELEEIDPVLNEYFVMH
jgi:hypothetical protein